MKFKNLYGRKWIVFLNDIIKYKKGELTSEQMHSLEKKALADPFLADALQELKIFLRKN